MKTILLSFNPANRTWMAEQLIDGSPDPKLLGLFGTHILPTPFTGAANGRDVRAAVAKLNPFAKVSLG